jgi:tRNA-dihydrouridine synthase
MFLANNESRVTNNGFWGALPHPILGLAPMDGVTDAPFRFTVATQGRPDVIFTEFTAGMDVGRGPARIAHARQSALRRTHALNPFTYP